MISVARLLVILGSLSVAALALALFVVLMLRGIPGDGVMLLVLVALGVALVAVWEVRA